MENWSNIVFNIGLGIIAIVLFFIPANKVYNKQGKWYAKLTIYFYLFLLVSIVGIFLTTAKEASADAVAAKKDSVIQNYLSRLNELDKLSQLEKLKKDTVSLYKTASGKTTLDICRMPLLKMKTSDTISMEIDVCNYGEHTALNASFIFYGIILSNRYPGSIPVIGKSIAPFDCPGKKGDFFCTGDVYMPDKFLDTDSVYLFAKYNWDNKENNKIGKGPVRRLFKVKDYAYFTVIADDREYNRVVTFIKDNGAW